MAPSCRPGLIERLLARCYQLGSHRRFWRTGCLLTLDVTASDGTVAATPTTASTATDATDGVARLLFDVDVVPIAEGVLVEPGTVAQQDGPVELQDGALGGADDKEGRDYAVRFEAFGPPGCMAQLTEAVGVGVSCLRDLMRDFPGLIAASALPADSGPLGLARFSGR